MNDSAFSEAPPEIRTSPSGLAAALEVAKLNVELSIKEDVPNMDVAD